MNDAIRQIVVMAMTGKSRKQYFCSAKKGENLAIRNELNSSKSKIVRTAVRKVIANMTLGKDVGLFFPEMLKCIQTSNLETKKLVYLYLMNYARSQPDLVVLAINTFFKDAENPNPLIRALAIRAMGCIKVEKVVDYFCEPLKKALNDSHPYVRKTAAIAVAKLYDLSPVMAKEQAILDQLVMLVDDDNSSVVSNAIASLSEIQSKQPDKTLFLVNASNLNRLLNLLDECTEWGQLFILEAISQYTPRTESEREFVMARIMPRLQHANPAIVLTSARVLITNHGQSDLVTSKIMSSLVTLLGSPHEMQYIVLRTLKLLSFKFEMSLDPKMFFCMYNDPIYIKLEKLDMMVSLVRNENVDRVMAELLDYTQEIDVEFVSGAIHSVANVACRVPDWSLVCASHLLDLAQSPLLSPRQTAIVALKDVLQVLESLPGIDVGRVFEDMDKITKVETRLALAWILGEYGHVLEHAPEYLEYFVGLFGEESTAVQHQILTAAVKLYVSMPRFVGDLVHALFQRAVLCENPDIRDRAYVYWRCLSLDPAAARTTIHHPRPFACQDKWNQEMDMLLFQIPSLHSVYMNSVKDAEDMDIRDDKSPEPRVGDGMSRTSTTTLL